MKNVFAMVSIAILSTAANAESNVETTDVIKAGQEVVESSQGAMSNAAQTEKSAVSGIIESEKSMDTTSLWKILDTDQDGTISKEEASASKEITDAWDNLDANKDDKLDSAEFAQLYSQEK
jgi:hypothetical protein